MNAIKNKILFSEKLTCSTLDWVKLIPEARDTLLAAWNTKWDETEALVVFVEIASVILLTDNEFSEWVEDVDMEVSLIDIFAAPKY